MLWTMALVAFAWFFIPRPAWFFALLVALWIALWLEEGFATRFSEE